MYKKFICRILDENIALEVALIDTAKKYRLVQHADKATDDQCVKMIIKIIHIFYGDINMDTRP